MNRNATFEEDVKRFDNDKFEEKWNVSKLCDLFFFNLKCFSYVIIGISVFLGKIITLLKMFFF